MVLDFKRFDGGGLELATIGAERFFYSKNQRRMKIQERGELTGNGWGELEEVCRSDLESDDEDSGEC